MNTTLLGLGLVSVSLCIAATASPSYAGNFQDSGKLPDASQFYKAPKRYQITDPDFIVTDNRHPKERSNISIHIPPAPQDINNDIHIGGDGTRDGGSSYIPILRSDLPDATGGGTNIPAGGVRPKTALPQGTTTNRLADVFGHRVPKSTSTQHPMLAQQPQATTGKKPTAVLSYPASSSNGSAGGSQKIKTSTIGELLRK